MSFRTRSKIKRPMDVCRLYNFLNAFIATLESGSNFITMQGVVVDSRFSCFLKFCNFHQGLFSNRPTDAGRDYADRQKATFSRQLSTGTNNENRSIETSVLG